MRGLFYALQFLTIIPLKTKHADSRTLASGLVYFPVVGLFLGLIIAACLNVMTMLKFNDFASAITVVILLVILTRAMHMDGLSDTADALFSGKPHEEMLKIMRDPQTGVMGVVAIVSVTLLKTAFLLSITVEHRAVLLVTMCILSRWSMVYSVFAFSYARPEGKAGSFIRGVDRSMFILATLGAVILAMVVAGWAGLVLLIVAWVVAYSVGRFSTTRVGGITGDTIGASAELSEMIILLSACILEGINLWSA